MRPSKCSLSQARRAALVVPFLLLGLSPAASGAMCIAEPAPNVGGANGGILFETDFSNDSGYSARATTLWNGNGSGTNPSVRPPTGWDGVIATGNSSISVVSGAGEDGGNALRIEYDPNHAQPNASLGKHLTGDESQGFDELWIRYRVKLPDNFMVGSNGNNIDYWKWGRLWQNTSIANTSPNKWTENRANSGFVVWVFSNDYPYTNLRQMWAHPGGPNLAAGSAGGARQVSDYYTGGGSWNAELSPGAFERFWDVNRTSRPGYLEEQPQAWHTIEFRFKLASSPTTNDGEFEVWFDGVSQGKPRRINNAGGAPSVSGIPTSRIGSGWNFFVLFDNLSGWNAQWGRADVDGYVLIDDVVVSRGYIGPTYKVQ